jgi:uncharacterized protein YigE (DUF2233 family)
MSPAGDNATMPHHPSAWRLLALVALLVVSIRSAHALESRVVHADEGDYRLVTIDLLHDALDLYWRDAKGEPYASIEALSQRAGGQGKTLAFATNAGMYDREYRPLGLTIADGKVLRALNNAHGSGRSGNFGMQPNGIFYVDRAGHAGVVETAAWRDRHVDARIATQSGPMLLIDGRINPEFLENSDSRKWRSGVCAPSAGKVVFAVSRMPVTFHAFARLMQERGGCRDALYLDGTLSQIYTAADGYSGAPAVMVKPYAGMLAVFASEPATR